MKIYTTENNLVPSKNVEYDNSNISQRISELNISLMKKFRESARKEHQSIEFAKKFVVCN